MSMAGTWRIFMTPPSLRWVCSSVILEALFSALTSLASLPPPFFSTMKAAVAMAPGGAMRT
jgi:hypothetical protein